MTRKFREILTVSSAWLAALVLSAPLLSSGQAARAGGGEPLRMETFKTHSRLSVHVDDGVLTEYRASPEGFELVLKGLGLSDLGAPLGEEGAWADRFRKLSDPRLVGLDFSEVAGGLKVAGRWRFGVGPEDPAHPVMESFDYRDRDRQRIVLDFWVKEGPTVGQVTARRAVDRRMASVREHENEEKARSERRLAREKARADAENPKLFCSTPLSERTDIFLEFLPVHEPVVFSRWFQSGAPDAEYNYYEPHGKAKDAQYVRLALRLYREGNFALVNRTLDFLDREHPGSSFKGEMRFLRANALLKLGLTEEGTALLKEISRESKPSRASLQAGMHLTLAQYAAKNYLSALESFTQLATRHSESRLAWVFHLGAAECARALRQTDRAAQEYRIVSTTAPTRQERAEGALRIGDLYLDRFQYDQALAAYAQSLRSFGGESESFASIHINRADALYGLGQRERAAEAYKSFLSKYAAHPAGWRAAYRLGELAARAEGSVDQRGETAKATVTRESPEARRWYLETINRYPFSPGAVLARLQLLPCGDHAGMTAEAVNRFFENEAEKFDGGSPVAEVAMDRYKDFRALARVRTLMTSGRQEEAVAAAVAELARVPRASARRWLNRLLSFNFRKSIIDLLEMPDGDGRLAALTFYQENADTVPLLEGSVDPSYLLRLSQAASDLGLGKLAQSISDVFAKASKAHDAIARELASAAPASTVGANGLDDDPDRRMAAAERAFTEAKAKWIGDGMKAADQVRARLGRVGPDSRFSYERELILGLIDQRSGDARGALRHAAQAQLLGPVGPSGLRDARVDAWVASLQAAVGNDKAALEAYRALESVAATGGPANGASSAAERLGLPPVPTRESLVLAECEILEKEGRWGEAAANFARAIDAGVGGAEAEYGYARALLKTGARDDYDKAISALEKLASDPAAVADAKGAVAGAAKTSAPGGGEKSKFWRKLASETLADEKAKQSAKEGTRP